MATRKWLPYFYYINPSFSFLKIHRLIKINLNPSLPKQPQEASQYNIYTSKKIINFITSCATY